MAFAYHLCASDFEGDILYSLDSLRLTFPNIYEREKQKYDGREGVLEYKVPLLGITWTQTVNLSALNPMHLIEERKRLGVPLSKLQSRHLVKIPLERLEKSRCVLYASSEHWINSRPGDQNVPLTPPEKDFREFDPANYVEPTTVPRAHTEYLLEQHRKGEVPLGFVFIPHILVANQVDISGLERIPLDALSSDGHR